MIWAARAQTVFYGNVLGYDRDEDWLNLVYYGAQRSLELDRNSHYAQVAIAQFHLYNRDFKAVIDICDRLLEKNPRSASNQLSTGFFRALAGDWDEGCQLLSKAIKRLHTPPGWAYKALFLNSYRLGRYEEALSFINQYFVPEHFQPPLLRAAVLYRLGRLDEAVKAADDVRRINPTLREHADTYFRYLSTSDDLTDDLQEALRHLDLI
jgi:tetratricopeptide (TPR) repeat protein